MCAKKSGLTRRCPLQIIDGGYAIISLSNRIILAVMVDKVHRNKYYYRIKNIQKVIERNRNFHCEYILLRTKM